MGQESRGLEEELDALGREAIIAQDRPIAPEDVETPRGLDLKLEQIKEEGNRQYTKAALTFPLGVFPFWSGGLGLELGLAEFGLQAQGYVFAASLFVGTGLGLASFFRLRPNRDREEEIEDQIDQLEEYDADFSSLIGESKATYLYHGKFTPEDLDTGFEKLSAEYAAEFYSEVIREWEELADLETTQFLSYERLDQEIYLCDSGVYSSVGNEDSSTEDDYQFDITFYTEQDPEEWLENQGCLEINEEELSNPE